MHTCSYTQLHALTPYTTSSPFFVPDGTTLSRTLQQTSQFPNNADAPCTLQPLVIQTMQLIQRCGFRVTEALLHMPIRTTTSDAHGHEWSTHYDDYGRPCPYNWPHGRHWQWAPHNIATTYAIPTIKATHIPYPTTNSTWWMGKPIGQSHDCWNHRPQ